LPADDDHGMANHEGRHIRTQPDDGRGDFLGFPHPSDRLPRDTRCCPSTVPPVKRCIIEVSMMPGQTALTRMLDCA
jgi:hypothetical protein